MTVNNNQAFRETGLLQVDKLKTYFETSGGLAKVVDGISFTLEAGKTLAIVGESGSGKTMLARSIMGLIPVPPGIVAGGSIHFQGQDLRLLEEHKLSALRGNDIAMIFQDPMSSLNPVLNIGEQLSEGLIRHKKLSKKEALKRALSLLEDVGVPAPQQRLGEYPHQLSGGLRQRVMIAIAIACDPAVLIADEPTTALDVSVQAQILRLLKNKQRQANMAMIFVSHDLATVAGIADDIAVMYAGKIVEIGPAKALIQNPRMPYTHALLQSIPRIDARSHQELAVIEGRPPDLRQLPRGCNFADRCQYAQQKCRESEPELGGEMSENQSLVPEHRFACWYPVADNKNKPKPASESF
ncbi:ABC transporter ATP-binding protein [Aurantivibrio infirmus]